MINTKRLLPILSDKGPLPPEPMIAPISMDETTRPSVKLFNGISSFIKSNAPEITPLS